MSQKRWLCYSGLVCAAAACCYFLEVEMEEIKTRYYNSVKGCLSFTDLMTLEYCFTRPFLLHSIIGWGGLDHHNVNHEQRDLIIHPFSSGEFLGRRIVNTENRFWLICHLPQSTIEIIPPSPWSDVDELWQQEKSSPEVSPLSCIASCLFHSDKTLFWLSIIIAPPLRLVSRCATCKCDFYDSPSSSPPCSAIDGGEEFCSAEKKYILERDGIVAIYELVSRNGHKLKQRRVGVDLRHWTAFHFVRVGDDKSANNDWED